MNAGATSCSLVYVIGTYPLPTTTFIDREIEGVRRLGVRVDVVSIRRPDARALWPRQRTLADHVRYILPARPLELLRSHLGFLARRPGAYVRTMAYTVSRPHPSVAARLRTVLHVGLAVHVARLLRDAYPTAHVHAHFVDRAALIALVAGRLLDRPFSATAHANDIYVDPVLLPEKIAAAKFVATCTRYNGEHLRTVANGAGEKVRCVYHGLDLGEYRPGSAPRRDPPVILAVGQLKEKKGFAHLLDACRLLADRGTRFACEIVGEGPIRATLAARIDRLGLDAHVRLLGALPHEDVVTRLREATVFALPSVTAPDGDRDGIPNVILEAMAMRLPVVSTRQSGIPEAVVDGGTGLLVPPGDATALADALGRLLADDALRGRLGRAGRARVEEIFDAETNARVLLEEVLA
jgi:colanic acid/amylovoran biosynthesis glycosyltransferase